MAEEIEKEMRAKKGQAGDYGHTWGREDGSANSGVSKVIKSLFLEREIEYVITGRIMTRKGYVVRPVEDTTCVFNWQMKVASQK